MTDEKEPSKEALEVAQHIEVPYKGMADVNFALALDACIESHMQRLGYPFGGSPDMQSRLRAQIARADAADARASKRGVAQLEAELDKARVELERWKAREQEKHDALEATKAELAALGELHDKSRSLWVSNVDAEKAAHAAARAELEATRKELALETKGRAEYREQIDVLIGDREALRAELESLRKPLEGELAEDVAMLRKAMAATLSWHSIGGPSKALDRIEAALRAKGEPQAAEPIPTAEEGAETVARLGIDVPRWSAKIRAKVSAVTEPPTKCDCAFADNADRLHHELRCPAAGPPEPRPIVGWDAIGGNARCVSVGPSGQRCVFGSGHSADYHSNYPEQWPAAPAPDTKGSADASSDG